MPSTHRNLNVLLCIAASLFTSFTAPAIVRGESHDHSHHQHSEMKASQPAKPADSIYNLESEWINQDGKSIRFNDLSGEPRLLVMLYTSCKTACPMLVGDMKSVRAKLPAGEASKLKMTLVSFDPDGDTPETLKAFQKTMKLDEKQWTLLSPRTSSDATELSALLGVRFKKLDSGDYIHSNILFFIDPHGRIVASQEGLNKQSPEFVNKIKTALRPSK